jgi:MFS family permease
MDTTTAPLTSPPSTPGKPGLLINRNFALLFGGQAISVIGDYIFTTTLVIWVKLITNGQSWSPLAVSAVILAAAIPMALLGPLAGVFVDRWDKRRTMLRSDVVRAVVVALMILVTGIVPLPIFAGGAPPLAVKLAAVYATVFIVNAADRFFRPGQIALIGDLVSPEHQPRAFGLTQAAYSLAIVIGPPVAAPLLISFGPQWALAIDAGTFVVSVLTLLAIHAPKAAVSVQVGERGHFWREFALGLRFLLSKSVLVVLVLLGMIVMLGGGALNALDIFFVTQNLHTPASLYGILGATQGIGLIMGALLGGALAMRLGMSRVVWLSVLLMGALIIAYSRMTLFTPAVALLFVAGLPNGAVNAVISPMLLRVTPRELIGRITSLLDPVIMLASIVGTALAGYLDAIVLRDFHASALGMSFGPVDTIFLGAGALFLLGGLLGAARLRDPQAVTEAAQPRVSETVVSEPAANHLS